MENEPKERNDLIRRGDAIDLCIMAIDDSWEYDYAEDRMFEIPAVDAVEVVRCKSCDMANDCSDEREMYCALYHVYKPIDYFCADGRRKEERNALD